MLELKNLDLSKVPGIVELSYFSLSCSKGKFKTAEDLLRPSF